MTEGGPTRPYLINEHRASQADSQLLITNFGPDGSGKAARRNDHVLPVFHSARPAVR